MKALVYGPVLALFSVLFFSSSTAFADAAVIIDFDGCSLLNGDGNAVVLTDQAVTITAQSNQDNYNQICTADVAPPSTGHAAVFNTDNTGGAECAIVINADRETVSTTDWHEVVSASGKAKLLCHFHN